MNSFRRTGMTLLELLVALGIFAVIMTAAFPLVDQMMARFQMARDHYVAASICQARIERARAAPYSDLSLMVEGGQRVDDYGNVSEPDGRFRRTTALTVDSPVAGMTTMTVRTDICICSRWGWRKHLHPLRSDKWVCRFTDEHEEMIFLFTEYKK
jgi:prepilin-type N-terminal cleavage/methylation domain-containing protein